MESGISKGQRFPGLRTKRISQNSLDKSIGCLFVVLHFQEDLSSALLTYMHELSIELKSAFKFSKSFFISFFETIDFSSLKNYLGIIRFKREYTVEVCECFLIRTIGAI